MDNADRAFEGLYATDGNVADNAAALRTAIAGGAITPAAIAAALGFLPAQGVGNSYLDYSFSSQAFHAAFVAQNPQAFTMTIPAATAVISGVTYPISAVAHTFNANKTTWIDAGSDGYHFVEGDPPSVVADGLVRTGWYAVTDGVKITRASSNSSKASFGPRVVRGIRLTANNSDGVAIDGAIFRTSVDGSVGSLITTTAWQLAQADGTYQTVIRADNQGGGVSVDLPFSASGSSGDGQGLPAFSILTDVLKDTPSAGGIENDGTSIYWTADDASRHKIADATNGITGTVTTASLVGKTLTFTNGVITGFA